MNGKKNGTVGDESMEKARRTYNLLNKEVKVWQMERGLLWQEKLSPAAKPPYYSFEDFPETLVLELWERLNRVRGISAAELVLRETWEQFKIGQTAVDPELLSCLQIALSGIARLCRAKIGADNLAESSAESAVCPICGQEAAFSVLKPPNGKRFLHCSLCGHEWPTVRTGCMLCGKREPAAQNYLNSREFPGIEVVVCEACGRYFKEFDLRLLAATDYTWEDMRTLPLNYAAEQWLAERAKEAGKTQ